MRDNGNEVVAYITTVNDTGLKITVIQSLTSVFNYKCLLYEKGMLKISSLIHLILLLEMSINGNVSPWISPLQHPPPFPPLLLPYIGACQKLSGIYFLSLMFGLTQN